MDKNISGFLGSKYLKSALAAGTPPRTPPREYTTLRRPQTGLEKPITTVYLLTMLLLRGRRGERRGEGWRTTWEKLHPSVKEIAGPVVTHDIDMGLQSVCLSVCLSVRVMK